MSKANRIDLAGQWLRSISGRDLDYVNVPGSYPPVGECTLSREFAANWPEDPGSRVFLVSEGVLAEAEFRLNDQLIGQAGPYCGYRFELPAGCLSVRNRLAVTVRDMPVLFGPTPGRRFDGGLHHDLWLERRPATFIENVWFQAELSPDYARAECSLTVKLDGPADEQLNVTLIERATGREVVRLQTSGRQAVRFAVEHPRLWSPQTPELYDLHVSLLNHPAEAWTEAVGFRRIETHGHDFWLNGQRLLLKGVCRHEFTPAGGYAPQPAELRRELAQIRHAGFNFVRLVHSPQSPLVCRLAAELGLLVSEEPGACFHDLGDERLAGPAAEAMRRTVLRDRNVPSVFAWLIYNECLPHVDYAVRLARLCRELDPGRLVAMADCSGRHEEIKRMVAAADLSFYGINRYDGAPRAYAELMEIYADRPLVFTEWGGCVGQENARTLRSLCAAFALHSREDEPRRMAGSCFWVWADYEEHSRARYAAPGGWTMEGLVDRAGQPKPDLLTLSQLCFEQDYPLPPPEPRIEILAPAPRRRENWQPLPLDEVAGDQTGLEERIDQLRSRYDTNDAAHCTEAPLVRRPPRFGELLADGLPFRCRDAAPNLAHPLLLGAGRTELVIPVGRKICGLAMLGQVALIGGYPSSTVYSVHHRDAEPARQPGDPAAEYKFITAEGGIVQPLRHGLEVLRANNICRWWTPSPRAPETRPAAQAVVHPAYEVLRLDLWETRFPQPVELERIIWRLKDAEAILGLWAVSLWLA